jgi:hypothetical protein
MPPALIVCLILGSLYGLVFFLLSGSTKRRVWYYWLVGVAGFLSGQIIAELVAQVRPLTNITLGDVYVIEASVVCWIALFLFHNRA